MSVDTLHKISKIGSEIKIHNINSFTFGRILEKHSSSSSDKPMCGKNISVIIFSIPVWFLYVRDGSREDC